MNVNALLNATSAGAAAGQPVSDVSRGIGSKAAIRSRTPWDAGGYALPIHTHPTAFTAASESYSRTPSIDSPDEQSPTMLGHKISESRSSVSSCVSTSSSHSRFSSLSTNSGFQPLSIIVADTKNISLQAESSDAAFDSLDTRRTQSLSPQSTTSSLSHPAHTVAFHQEDSSYWSSGGDKPQDSTMAARGPSAGKDASSARPASPTDAFIIKRSAAEPALSEASPAASMAPRMDAASTAHSHKRSYSAPDFGTISEPGDRSMPGALHLPSSAQPTPPRSQTHSPEKAWAGVQPEGVTDYENVPVTCMYIENCDTGSQPRKAISHIFGRNKMCTRLIPQGVWVHYCRKHYQRSRYRNPKEYAKLQCDLVQKQIYRLHDWSEGNLRRGTGPVVKDWGLSVRKREQKRLDELNTKNAGVAYGESDVDDDATSSANTAPATAVPQWLLKLCGRGYPTTVIMDIFNRLHRELLDEIIPVFPDIEILPNIVVDREEPASPKGYVKRRPIDTPHRRTQSLGTALRTDLAPNASTDLLGAWTPVTPTQKRKRLGGGSDDEYVMERPLARMRITEQPPRRRAYTHQHRRAMSDMNAQLGFEDGYSRFEPRQMAPLYEHVGDSSLPLPAPVAQRRSSLSTAANLEARHLQRQLHSGSLAHQRSQSDASGFRQPALPPTYHPTGLMYERDGTAPAGHVSMFHSSHGIPSRNQYSEDSDLYSQRNYAGSARHSRHQSTPVSYYAPSSGTAVPPIHQSMMMRPEAQEHQRPSQRLDPHAQSLYAARR